MKHIRLSITISAVLGFLAPLPAAVSGIFNYTDKGSEITIDWFKSQPVGAVLIPKSINGKPVTALSHTAFNNCNKQITSVSIPSSVTSIYSGIFGECQQLNTFAVDPANPAFSSAEGILLDKDRTHLICFPPGKSPAFDKIPTEVTIIDSEAFSGCKQLTTIAIPLSITTISSRAFDRCEQLKSITIPASVIQIDTLPFTECAQLAAITVDPANPKYSSLDGVLFSKDMTRLIYFPVGKSEDSYRIPPTVTCIEVYAFLECQNLASVTVPASVTRIKSEAFGRCHKLQEITFLGNAPAVSYCGFRNLLSDLKFYHMDGKTGFSSPTWQTYPCVNKSDPSTQVPAIPRTLINASGGKLDVILLEVSRTKVKVKRSSDGKEFSIEIASLSAADQEYIKGLGRKPESPNAPQVTSPLARTDHQGFIKDPVTPQSIAQEFSRLEKAATGGDSEAQLQLADRYGIGAAYSGGAVFVSDNAKSYEWLEKAAVSGHGRAQFQLAQKGGTKAVEWLKKAAAGGYAKAQFELAGKYGHGDGVARDDTKAAEWLEKAAQEGDASAQIAMARTYMEGGKTPKDSAKAAMWARKAVEDYDIECDAYCVECGYYYGVSTSDTPNQGRSILTMLAAGIQKFTIPLNGVDVQVKVIGKGSTGVVFFNNSGPMNSQIADHMLTYAPLLSKGYSILLWSYPQAAPFDKVQAAIGSWMGGTAARVDFSGVASAVMKGIRGKTGLKNFLIVGNSLGAGVLMWDYQELCKDEHIKFLLISPTESFMPDPATLAHLKNGTIIANDVGDNFVKSEVLKKWIAANKCNETAPIPPGHLIIGENLTHTKTVQIIQQQLSQPHSTTKSIP